MREHIILTIKEILIAKNYTILQTFIIIFIVVKSGIAYSILVVLRKYTKLSLIIRTYEQYFIFIL